MTILRVGVMRAVHLISGLPTMTRKPEAKQDDPEQSKRFIQAGREQGAAETEKEAQRAFKKVVQAPKPPKK